MPQGRGRGLPSKRARLRDYTFSGGGNFAMMIRREPVEGDHGFVARRMDMEEKLRYGDPSRSRVHEVRPRRLDVVWRKLYVIRPTEI